MCYTKRLLNKETLGCWVALIIGDTTTAENVRHSDLGIWSPFERMPLDKVTSSWKGVRGFASSPAVSLTPVLINTAKVPCLVKESNAVKSGKTASWGWMSRCKGQSLSCPLLYKIRQRQTYFYKNTISVEFEEIKYINISLIPKGVTWSLPRQRVSYFKDLKWFYLGLMNKSLFFFLQSLW